MNASRKRHLSALVLVAVAGGVIVGLQLANHAYESEFGRTWDEAAHFVTGLMVFDFLRSDTWSSPMGFAENYYLHYPKVALGHWPPFFYMVQAVWYFVLSPSRLSILVLIAALSCALAVTTWSILRRRCGDVASAIAAVVLVTLPLSQELYSVAMAEMLLAVLALWAALALGRYLDSPSWKWSVLFSLLATLAILVKPNGLALALLPPLAVLFSGKTQLIRKASFWVPAPLVLLVCGPWYAMTLEMMKNGPLESAPKFWYTVAAARIFSRFLAGALGWIVMILLIFGAARVVRHARRTAVNSEGKWICLVSLVVSTLLFHWIIPSSFEPRHIFMALAPSIALALVGFFTLVEQTSWPRISIGWRLSVWGILALLLHGLVVWEIPLQTWRGFDAVVNHIENQPDYSDSVVLVISDSRGEGAFVAATASVDERPTRVVLRGSKVLLRSDWSGSEVEVLFSDTDQLHQYMRQVPVGLVVLDFSVKNPELVPERTIVLEMLEERKEDWKEVGSFEVIRRGESSPHGLTIHSQLGHQSMPRGPLEIDLEMMLGRTLTEPSRESPR